MKEEELLVTTIDLETFLSPNVHHLVVEIGKSFGNPEDFIPECSYLTELMTYDWSKIKDLIAIDSDEFSIHEQSSLWFIKTVRSVWPVYLDSYNRIFKEVSANMKLFWDFCKWTGRSEEIYSFYEDFLRPNTTTTVEALLYLSSVLEQSLGNVFLLKGKTVPFLLRDLLATKELSSVLGTVPTVFLQLLLGTPLGLNVRNLVWHGFPRPDEMSPVLAAALFVAVASIGYLLSSMSTPLPRRPLITNLTEFATQMGAPPTNLVPDEILHTLLQSKLVPESHVIYWQSAVQHYQSGRWGHCCLVALPQLEQLMRTAYCIVKNCPSRLLTAESTTRYLTLDELLDASDTHPLSVLEDGLLHMLRDLLTHPAGPRLRDRLSHGQIDLRTLPQELAGHVLGAVAGIALCFQSSIHQPYYNYCSKFHSVALLKAAIIQAADKLSEWRQCPRPPEVNCPGWDVCVESDIILCELHHQLIQLLAQLTLENLDVTRKCQEQFCLSNSLKIALSTVTVPIIALQKNEAEVISLLRQAVEKVLITSSNVLPSIVQRSHLLAERKLRSRQRLTLVRMLTTAPLLETALTCVIIIVTANFISITSIHAASIQCNAKYLRFLRNILQFTESVASESSPAKNRWEEIGHVVTHFSNQMLQSPYLRHPAGK